MANESERQLVLFDKVEVARIAISGPRIHVLILTLNFCWLQVGLKSFDWFDGSNCGVNMVMSDEMARLF